MLENLKIENFRGFQSFELQQLGRVNLLVGQNNSGKTSILEAIQLLCSRTNIEPLYQILERRGEFIRSDEFQGIEIRYAQICHLFYGHEIKLNSQFSIAGKRGNNSEKIKVSVGTRSSEYRSTNESKKSDAALTVNIDWSNNFEKESMSTSFSNKNAGIPMINDSSIVHLDSSLMIIDGEVVQNTNSLKNKENKFTKTQFVTSSSLTTAKMIEFFDQVVLTPEEKVIQDAVKMIDSNISRIAPVSSSKYRNSGFREGFVVLRADNHQRVPIGSFGDGTWRILGLALAIVNVKDGVLLVDEIDTGLHFTAMSKMWKLIWETAKRLNVQVFATTHNSDCWKSLASIACQENIHEAGGITIQRIEPDKNTAIAFNEREIVIAAERDLEVR